MKFERCLLCAALVFMGCAREPADDVKVATPGLPVVAKAEVLPEEVTDPLLP